VTVTEMLRLFFEPPKCPSCRAPFSHDGGCMSMSCKGRPGLLCKVKFCLWCVCTYCQSLPFISLSRRCMKIPQELKIMGLTVKGRGFLGMRLLLLLWRHCNFCHTSAVIKTKMSILQCHVEPHCTWSSGRRQKYRGGCSRCALAGLFISKRAGERGFSTFFSLLIKESVIDLHVHFLQPQKHSNLL
jgi:hypothetical protein